MRAVFVLGLLTGVFGPFGQLFVHHHGACGVDVAHSAFTAHNSLCRAQGTKRMIEYALLTVLCLIGLYRTRPRRHGLLRHDDPNVHVRAIPGGIELRGWPLRQPFTIRSSDILVASTSDLDLSEVHRVPWVLDVPAHPFSKARSTHLILRHHLPTPLLDENRFLARNHRWSGMEVELISFPADEDTALTLWRAGVPTVDDLGPSLVEHFGRERETAVRERRLTMSRRALLALSLWMLVLPVATLPFFVVAIAGRGSVTSETLVWAGLGAIIGSAYTLVRLWIDRSRISDEHLVLSVGLDSVAATGGAVVGALFHLPWMAAVTTLALADLVGVVVRRSRLLEARPSLPRPSLFRSDPTWPPPGASRPLWHSRAALAIAMLIVTTLAMQSLVSPTDARASRLTSAPAPTEPGPIAVPTSAEIAAAGPAAPVPTLATAQAIASLEEVRHPPGGPERDTVAEPLDRTATDDMLGTSSKRGRPTGGYLIHQPGEGDRVIALEVFDTPAQAVAYDKLSRAERTNGGLVPAVPPPLEGASELDQSPHGWARFLTFVRGRVRVVILVATNVDGEHVERVDLGTLARAVDTRLQAG